MKTLWTGTLARSGRKPVEFQAEIVDVDGAPEIIERLGINVARVSPHEINGAYWLKAMVSILQKGGE
jgi:hypothetical protein